MEDVPAESLEGFRKEKGALWVSIAGKGCMDWVLKYTQMERETCHSSVFNCTRTNKQIAHLLKNVWTYVQSNRKRAQCKMEFLQMPSNCLTLLYHLGDCFNLNDLIRNHIFVPAILFAWYALPYSFLCLIILNIRLKCYVLQ